MDQINKYLCYKWKLNGVNVVKQSDGTLWDSCLKPNLFNADKLHLIKERNAKLAVSIYNSINLNAVSIKVYESLQNCFAIHVSKEEDFSMLSYNVSVCSSICKPDNPFKKCVSKFVFKPVSTSSVLPGKPISISDVGSS